MLRTMTVGAAALLLGLGTAYAASGDDPVNAAGTVGATGNVQPDAHVENELPPNARLGMECAENTDFKTSASSGQPGSLVIKDASYIPCDNIEGREDVSTPDQGTAGDAGAPESAGN